MKATLPRWDVFCRVVDHFGDAGVCWRLARLLAHEHPIDVTLWIDRIATLARIVDGVDPTGSMDQVVDRVRIRVLGDGDDAAHGAAPADVVVEGFGCGLPGRYLDAMERAQPVWINLEYLSADPWVDGAHGLPSPQPSRPLTRGFFFPGFTAATGAGAGGATTTGASTTTAAAGGGTSIGEATCGAGSGAAGAGSTAGGEALTTGVGASAGANGFLYSVSTEMVCTVVGL